MSHNWGEVLGPSGPPVPTKLVDELPGKRQVPLKENSNVSAGCSELERKIAGILERLDDCTTNVGDLRRKQDEMASKTDQFYQKQDEADSNRRSQIDCISQRVFDAEKQLSEAQHLQDDAIAKANAVFEKHASEVEQERQNLMSVIGQVNRNFEHLSNEIAQHGNKTMGYEQEFLKLQMDIESLSEDRCQMSEELRKQSSFDSGVHHTLTVLEQASHQLQARVDDVVAEQQKAGMTLSSQQEDLTDVHAKLEDLGSTVQKTASSLGALLQSLPQHVNSQHRLPAAAEEARSDYSDDPVTSERAAPEPAALAQPAFCSRPRRLPETASGNNRVGNVNSAHQNQSNGAGFPFGSPTGDFGLWREEEEAEAIRGASTSSNNAWRHMPESQQRRPEACQRNGGLDPDISESDSESDYREAPLPQEWRWKQEQRQSSPQDHEAALRWRASQGGQHHSQVSHPGVPPKTVPDFVQHL